MIVISGNNAGRARLALRSFVALIAVVFTSMAQAESVAYEINFGSANGFQHSFLHSATGSMDVGGVTYYPSGSKLLSLSGTLSGTWDTVTQTFTASNSLLDGAFAHGATSGALATEFGLSAAAVAAATWQVQITGGTVGVAGNSYADGSLQYAVLMTDGGGTTTIDSGSFYFYPVNFPGSPNTISQTRLDLWGNNFQNPTAGPSSVTSALGIDLGGDGMVVVPTPSAAIAGLAMLGAVSLRRQRKSA